MTMSNDNVSSGVGSTTLVNIEEEQLFLNPKKVISLPFYGYWFELSFGIDNEFICYRIFNGTRQSVFYGIDLSCNEFNTYIQKQKILPTSLTNIFLYQLVSRSVNTYIRNNEENFADELANDEAHLNLINTFINFTINMNMTSIDSIDTFEENRIEFIQKLNELSLVPEGIINEFNFVISNTIRIYVQNVLENNITTDDFWKPIDIHISNEDFEKIIIHRRMSKKLRTELSCDNTCTICLEDIRPNQITTIIGCKHVFHKKCAKEWFTKKCNKPVCPCCRTDVREQKCFGSNVF